MFDFIYANLEYFLSAIAFIITFIFSVLTLCKTRNIKKFKEEYEQMKLFYRTEAYTSALGKNDDVNKGQSFSEEKPVYKLNKATGELEKTDEKINIQELINSNLETAFERVLERFLPVDEEVQGVKCFNELTDNLDYLLHASSIAEDYKSKNGLDPSLSIEQVFSVMAKDANALKINLEAAQAKKEEAKVVAKQVIEEVKLANFENGGNTNAQEIK